MSKKTSWKKTSSKKKKKTTTKNEITGEEEETNPQQSLIQEIVASADEDSSLHSIFVHGVSKMNEADIENLFSSQGARVAQVKRTKETNGSIVTFFSSTDAKNFGHFNCKVMGSQVSTKPYKVPSQYWQKVIKKQDALLSELEHTKVAKGIK